MKSEVEYVKELLRAANIRPSRMRGQNFLIERSLASILIAYLKLPQQLSAAQPVLEIGAGPGVMTEELARLISNSGHEETANIAPGFLRVVEIEEAFCKALPRRIPVLSEKSVICEDVRNLSVNQIFGDLEGFEKCVVVSNVPYSISTEVVFWIIENRLRIKRAGLLLQKEFAARMASPPGSKVYGSLSVQCQLYARVEVMRTVPGSVFMPPTEVDSSFVLLEMRDKPLVELSDFGYFEKIVRAAFGQRRKTLLNSLSASGQFTSKEEVGEILKAVGIDPGLRPEVLSIEEFARIAEAGCRRV